MPHMLALSNPQALAGPHACFCPDPFNYFLTIHPFCKLHACFGAIVNNKGSNDIDPLRCDAPLLIFLTSSGKMILWCHFLCACVWVAVALTVAVAVAVT